MLGLVHAADLPGVCRKLHNLAQRTTEKRLQDREHLESMLARLMSPPICVLLHQDFEIERLLVAIARGGVLGGTTGAKLRSSSLSLMQSLLWVPRF